MQWIWNRKQICISLDEKTFAIVDLSTKKSKSFLLNDVKMVPKSKNGHIQLSIKNGRIYEIRNDENENGIGCLIQYLQYFQDSQQIVQSIFQEIVPHPIKINYFATIRSLSFVEDYAPEHHNSNSFQAPKRVETTVEPIKRLSSFIKDTDWRRNQKSGGVIFINEQKKSLISKMIKYIIKRVISTGSFMGISFPTFAMKPESILQTYCKCLGAAPLLFDNLSVDPVQRMKAFNTLILTMSLQFNDIEKPFNPVIGETFQGQIAGYPIYAEQISHHPPISSFLLDGKNYVLHGSLELYANLGINSAVGIFYGDVTIQFDDGAVIKGRMPSGTLTGIIIGETRFGPIGGVYSYDKRNKIVSSYQLKQRDMLIGFIGRLKKKSYQKFVNILQTSGKEKYENFKSFKENDFEEVLSKMEASWTSYVKFDGKMYFDYLSQANLPIKLTQRALNGQKLLQSDSSHRMDIKFRSLLKIEQAQDEKQAIEQEQRRLRKLRQKHNQSLKKIKI